MADGNFRERTEDELNRLSDEGLIDYIRNARTADRGDAMTLALRILVFGYFDLIRYRVALKVPREEVEEQASRAMESALTSAFAGESVSEFRSWLNTITSRRIADFHRGRENAPDHVALPEEHEGSDEVWGEVAGRDFEGSKLDAERAIQEAYGALSAAHQRIVDLYVFAGHSAGEVAERCGESVDNVHQVASRFRKHVRDLLDDGDTP